MNGPPNPPAEAPRVPRGSVGRGMGRGGALPVRASPYTDARRNPGGAIRAPGPAAFGYGPAQTGVWGQPHGGWPQLPRRSPAGAGLGGAEARRNLALRTEADFYRQWGCGGTPPTRPAGGPPVRPAAGAPAHRGPAAAGGPPVRPEAGAPAHGGPAGEAPAGEARPTALAPPGEGTAEDFRQQEELGFAHSPYGLGDPKGNSWSEKFNMWLHRVGSIDGRDRRFEWQTWQEGTPWRATPLVRPRL